MDKYYTRIFNCYKLLSSSHFNCYKLLSSSHAHHAHRKAGREDTAI